MLDPLETILRQCAEAAPNPWYPSGYAQANGMKRDDLDPHLDQLRMAGLIHLTDWVQGRGQGYALTPGGKRILQSPRELARLRAGKLDNPRDVLQEPPGSTDRPPTAFERGEQIRAAFLFPSPPLVSYALIFINVIWFLWGITIALQHGDKLNNFLYASTPDVLRRTGALSGEYIVQGGWGWGRLITCCFVHIGLLHLGVNMYSLWAVGPFFEQLWGRGRFLVLYLIAGLGGSCAMVINNPRIIGAGASGALWGILAAHAVWIVANRRHLPGPLASQMLRQVVIVLVINVGITYGVPNISAAAHFGGGAVGAVTALLLHYHRFGVPLLRRLALLGLVAIPVLCVGAVAEAERVDPRWQLLRLEQLYDHARMEVAQLIESRIEPFERQRLKVHSLPEVRQAVVDLGRARAILYEASARLQRPGRDRFPELEAKRQKYVQELVRGAQALERDEMHTFVEPLLADEIRRAGRVYEEQNEALQKLAAHQLTAKAVEQAVAHCRLARQDVQTAIEILRNTIPYHDPKLERQRLAKLDDLEETFRGWDRTEERMRQMAKSTPPSKEAEPD